jgi:hypothetical protein
MSVGVNHPQGEKMNLEEASMNFDSENVRPFLERLKPLVESGFSDGEVLQVQRMMEDLKIDEEKELEFPIHYRGRQTILRVRIFMDDVNSPDVYFFTDPELAKEIDKELERFADELGI